MRALIFRRLVVLGGALTFASRGYAEPATAVLVETDPATFVFHGFAAHVRLRPKALPHWTFGGGAYALDLPSPFVELDPANRGKGWHSRISLGGAAFVDHYFHDDARGLFIGAQVGFQRYRITRDGAPGATDFTALLLMPRVGYTWQPFDAGFYVMPWLGIGTAPRVAGDVTLAGQRYDVFPLVAFATLHAGWRFE
jgi:hypothetical protein